MVADTFIGILYWYALLVADTFIGMLPLGAAFPSDLSLWMALSNLFMVTV